MATVQWRPEINPLTTPQSWRPLHLPRSTSGCNDLAARIAQKHSALDEEIVKTTLKALVEEIKLDLINGNQAALEDAFTFRVSLNARLDEPDDPLPPIDNILNIRVIIAKAFQSEVQRLAQLERLPVSKKLPVITSAEDMVLKLNDVLNPNGALHLSGNALLFERENGNCGCVLEGTRGGRQRQTRCTAVFNSEITLLPDIPAQQDPWNNEYILSVTTQYTENGTLRTGIYERRLRTPLTLTNFGHPNPPDVGILTGNAAAAYVTVTGGALSADETVRIQAVLDLHEGSLSLNLLDMTEGGKAGAAVKVTGNGPITLAGFTGSALSSLNLTVNNFADLVKMIRENYSGRLADVLVMKVA
ncbi:DUF4469 domain-containing protein [Candidatus Electronema sp. JM]|uniref:DUF4469 domain-containing protein n=1 Tax=Candidatus Electronema sp. JM TaxID=3401571 RepID=UPI003AA871CE